MKNTKKLILLFLLLLPFFGNAAGIIPDALVPSACRDGCPCSLCDLYELAGRIINFLLYSLSIPIAIVMFLWGGFKLLVSGGNETAISQGRAILLNTVVGLALAFLGWVIINTLLDTLQFGFNRIASGGFGAWYERPSGCDNLPKSCRLPEIHKLDQPPAGPPAALPQGAFTDGEARAILTAAGIQILSSGNCNNQFDPDCTSLEGIPQHVVNELIELNKNCTNCIAVHGGTEIGHDSHGPGRANVDIVYSEAAISTLRARNYPINAGYGSGATCEPPGGGNQAVTCGPGAGVIHVEF